MTLGVRSSGGVVRGDVEVEPFSEPEKALGIGMDIGRNGYPVGAAPAAGTFGVGVKGVLGGGKG